MLGQLMGAIAMAAAIQQRQEMGDLVFLKAIIDNNVPAVKQMLQREPRLVRSFLTLVLVCVRVCVFVCVCVCACVVECECA